MKTLGMSTKGILILLLTLLIVLYDWSKSKKIIILKKSHHAHTDRFSSKNNIGIHFFLEFFMNNFIVLCHYLTLDVLDVISFFWLR